MTPYYQDDLVTIYNCDWREVLPIEADLVLTDPPYGSAVQKDDGRIGDGKLATNKRYIHVANDHSPDEAKKCVTLLTEVPKQIWWGANHFGDVVSDSPCWLVWDKDNGDSNFADCELAWTNLDGAVRIFRHRWNGMLRASEKTRWHPTQKPVALMDWCIARAKLKPNSLIFDPFMGGGPVAVAAKRAGHRYVGCELVEKYCEIAAKRLAQGYLWDAEAMA